MLRVFLALLLFASTVGVASAQESSGDLICTSIARYWDGDMAEVRNITSQPIPVSYRGVYEGTGCSRWSLIVPSLLYWHRRIGTEDSMRAAIDYLSEDLLKDIGGKTVEEKIGTYGTLANYNLIGAEAFESRPLIIRAAKHLDKAQVLAKTLPPEKRTSWYSSEFLNTPNFSDGERDFNLEKLSRDIAVSRALISGTKRDAERAAEVLAAANIPAVKEVINLVEDTRSAEICDLDKADMSEALWQACDNWEEYYFNIVRIFLTQKTLLSTVQDRYTDPIDTNNSGRLFYDAGRLLLLGAIEDGAFPVDEVRNPNHYEIANFRLHLALADLNFYLGERAYEAEGAMGYSRGRGRLADGLDHLLLAERFAPRHTSPSQWKRIAERYVTNAKFQEGWLVEYSKTWEEAGAIYQNETQLDTDRQLQLAYFEEGLKSLEAGYPKASASEKNED